MKDQRLQKLAKLLVEYSTEVQAGEKVCILADDVAIPFVVEVAREAVKKGAIVDYFIDVNEVNEIVLKEGNDHQIEQPNLNRKRCIDEADVWISAWGSKNLKYLSNVDSKKLQLQKKANTEANKTYRKRFGEGTSRWVGTQFPTHADAQEAEMSLEEYEDFVYSAGLLHMEDPVAEWKKVAESQGRWCEFLNTKSEIHIISKGTDIKATIKGRKWVSCDGRRNFPDGEIFTTPVETEVNGHITFSFPAIYSGKEIENVYLEVKDGKVIKATASKGEDLLNSFLDVDEGARRFGELAIATNYGIQKFTKNILFDEKIGGTIHMAVGSSFAETGGINESAIHWDMICDMRDGGEIYADGQLFYQNGKFLDSVL